MEENEKSSKKLVVSCVQPIFFIFKIMTSSWGKISLWDAAADGDLEKIKSRLGSSWTNVNAKDQFGNTAMHEAARWGHDDIINYLVKEIEKIRIAEISAIASKSKAQRRPKKKKKKAFIFLRSRAFTFEFFKNKIDIDMFKFK